MHLFQTVRAVRDEVQRRCAVAAPIPLEVITTVFINMTDIDEIALVRFDVPPENPIIGRFSRWNRQPGVYAPYQTFVEIAYASHLPRDWMRFVVCKELCHALDSDSGSYSVTEDAVDKLTDVFALRSALSPIQSERGAHRVELLAEVAAVELLLPIQVRDDFLRTTPNPTEVHCTSLSEIYQIPIRYVEFGLDAEVNNTLRGLMSE